MTTGTRGPGLVQSGFINTACSVNSTIVSGWTVSWSGADAVKRYSPPPVLRYERKLEYLIRGAKKGNPAGPPRTGGRGLTAYDPAEASNSELALASRPQDLFSTTRDRRIRVYEAPEINDRETPHVFNKSWNTRVESTFLWSNGLSYVLGTRDNCGFNPITIPLVWKPDDDYKIIERLRKKVVGTDFNLFSFLGAEGRDTVKWLGETANRIYRSAHHMARARPREAFKVLKEWGRAPHDRSLSGRDRLRQEDIYRDLLDSASGRNRNQQWSTVPASTWLEWHLAIAPLLGDVRAGAEQLAHVLQAPRSRKYKASVKKQMSYPALPISALWIGKRTMRKSVVGIFTSTPDPINFLGFQDPEVVLWNALPLSFVADYILNIGGYLEALASRAAFPQGIFVTTFKDEVRLTACCGRTNTNGTLGPGQFIERSEWTKLQEYKGSIARTISSSLEVPPPKVVPFSANQSWQRSLTVFSLFSVFLDPFAKIPPLR